MQESTRHRSGASTAAALLGLAIAAPPAAAGLIFSEYLEGSGRNKALELFNTGPDALDLRAFAVRIYFNGRPRPGRDIRLSGTLAPGDAHVLAHRRAAPALREAADQTSGGAWFNGNDAVVLVRGRRVVDAIGRVGEDPGAAWGRAAHRTRDNTLRRRPGITAGDADPGDPFDPAAGWVGYGPDRFDGLGAHASAAGPAAPAGPPEHGACGAPATPIHRIQGAGHTSPLAGATLTVEAVVTGSFQDPEAGLGGFFVQSEDREADADPATSEGLFVYDDGAEPGIAVSEGDRVRASGMVVEHGPADGTQTELASVSAVTLCGPGGAVSPATLELPVAGMDELERIEGMRVQAPQALTVVGIADLGRYGTLTLATRRLIAPTQVAAPGHEALAARAANARHRILLDDGSWRVDPVPQSHPRAGDGVAGLDGVLGFAFGRYRVHPLRAPRLLRRNTRPSAPPREGPLRVAGLNAGGYFNGDGRGGGFGTRRGARNAAEHARQRAKLVAAIRGLEADIVGLSEVENDGYGPASAIHGLVAALNAAMRDRSQYAFVHPGRSRLGPQAIAVALIYRMGAVSPAGAPAILDGGVDPSFRDHRNRPALAQAFQLAGTGERLTVVINHLKSKSGTCAGGGDPDRGDGQGPCSGTRAAAARALVRWLAADPTGSGDPDRLIIGDLNAYPREAPITLLGAAGYQDLVGEYLGNGAYTYLWRGQAGYLDHALASPSLAEQVAGVAIWHINADETPALGYRARAGGYDPGPYRASDHDPVVVDLRLDGARGRDARATP